MKSVSYILKKHILVLKIIFYSQTLVTLFLGLGFLLVKDGLWGLSALLGGAIAIIPQLGFMLVYFRKMTSYTANKIVNALFLAEILKWFITLGLFTASFQWSKLKPLALLMSFIATQLVFWLVPLIYEYSVRVYSTSSRASHSKNKLGDL